MKTPKLFSMPLTVADHPSLRKSEFPLSSRKRARVRGLLNRLEASDVLEQISIVIMLAGLLLFGATFANGASLDDVLAKRKAEATIDLATGDLSRAK